MKKILVMMSTYNGEKYLIEQLNSLLNQENVTVDLLVRDDCSKDRTIKILEEYKNFMKLDIVIGENLGPSKSFMELVKLSGDDYDYYAFADQDDFWEKDKLKSAIEQLEIYENNVKGAVYYSSLNFVDSSLNLIQQNKTFYNIEYLFKEQFFSRNNVAGCTMVFNSNFMKLIKENILMDVGMHDKWLILLALYCGTSILFDKTSRILYRQHTQNVTGDKTLRKKIKSRFNRVFKRDKYNQLYANHLLNNYKEYINEDDVKQLEYLVDYSKNIKYIKYMLFNKHFYLRKNNNEKSFIKILISNKSNVAIFLRILFRNY